MKNILVSILVLASMIACTSKQTTTEGEDPKMVLFREVTKLIHLRFIMLNLVERIAIKPNF